MPKLGRRSERTELDYQMAPEIVRKDAPFGTEATPTITMKIIGGRQVPVIEKHATYNVDNYGSRIQPLRPIADKPNHLDPRVHGDNPGGYYNKDVQEDNLSPRPTNFANKRPDSKDVVRGQFKALPPIQQNRTRNDLSTVFEAEPWTDNKNPSLAKETEYKQNYFLGRELEKGMEGYQDSGHKDFHYVSVNEKYEVTKLLRGDVLLPTDPITLSDSQTLTLKKLVCNDLNRFNPVELRDVYLECSQRDKGLRGFCPIDILDHSLRSHQANISDLRLIAAQYVDPNYPGMVNYERVLSFIGSVMQENARGMFEANSWSQEKQPKYYLQNGETFQSGSIYRDREIAKLLRMVEQELSKNTYSMDWTRWQTSFHERDRDHRNTLSGAQIKDICYDQKLPLPDSLINRILELCEDNNRDGQYKWSLFLDFLNKVRPSNTGLPMPVSKRPLEYAKHFPEPGPNWPRTDTDTERRERNTPRQDFSPRRGENRPDERGQTPVMRVPTPRGPNEFKDVDDREAYSADRYKSRDRTPPRDSYHDRSRDRTPPGASYHDRSPLPMLRLNSPPASHKSRSPSPKDNCNHPQYQQRETFPALEYNDFYNKQERDRNYTERYDNENEYRRSRRGIYEEQKFNPYGYDKRKSYAEDPSGYQPSWQQNVPKRSKSPPTARRIYERDPYRREERPEDSTYERHWRNWAYKSNREPRALQRVPSRYNRPKSYAEPPRKTSFPKPEVMPRRPYSYRDEIRFVQDQNFGVPPRVPSRLQSPFRRNQSVSPVRQMSPVRHMSPVRGQSLPNTYREPYGDQSFRDHYREQYPYQYDYMEAPDDRYNDRDNYQQRDGGMNSFRDDYRQSWGRGGGRGEESPRREQKIHQLSNQLRNLETQYEVSRDGYNSTEKPWLDRYIKMAQALYNSDITNRGSLPRHDVMEIVNQYNNAFNLKLDMTRANMLAISPDNLDKSGNIMLRPFLASLSSERFTYQP